VLYLVHTTRRNAAANVEVDLTPRFYPFFNAAEAKKTTPRQLRTTH
jgi:hypothetical protein